MHRVYPSFTEVEGGSKNLDVGSTGWEGPWVFFGVDRWSSELQTADGVVAKAETVDRYLDRKSWLRRYLMQVLSPPRPKIR